MRLRSWSCWDYDSDDSEEDHGSSNPYDQGTYADFLDLHAPFYSFDNFYLERTQRSPETLRETQTERRNFVFRRILTLPRVMMRYEFEACFHNILLDWNANMVSHQLPVFFDSLERDQQLQNLNSAARHLGLQELLDEETLHQPVSLDTPHGQASATPPPPSLACPMSTQPMPTHPVSSTSVPAEPVLTQPMPTHPVPSPLVPAKPVPTQPMPTHRVPSPSAPAKPMPTNQVPMHRVPAQPASTPPVPTAQPPANTDLRSQQDRQSDPWVASGRSSPLSFLFLP